MSADELRPAYRTLNEPSRLFGLSISSILASAVAGGLGYAWLLISPLPWRANLSTAVIALGAPLVLLVVRESAALSPARLLLSAIRWRTRPSSVDALTASTPVRRGAVRLDEPPADSGSARSAPRTELPWLRDDPSQEIAS
jgi:hypothetical protein